MKKLFDYMKTHPLLTGVIGFVYGVCMLKLLSPGNGDLVKMTLLRLSLAIGEAFFLYLISGAKVFEVSADSTWYTVRNLLWVMVYPVGGLILSIVSSLKEGKIPVDNWISQLSLTFLFCILVGFFEEITFRCVANDCLLYRFRDKKHIFVVIAIVTSLAFGAVHVVGADVSTPLLFVQAVFKTVQTALVGLCFLFLYWKTRNLLGIAIIHGFFDFLTMVEDAVFTAKDDAQLGSAESYVIAGKSDGMAALVSYFILIVVITAAAAIIYKKVVKTIDFDEIRKSW